MLYFPWRNEMLNLEGNFLSFKEHYSAVKDIVSGNEAMFSVNAQELDRAYEDLQRMGQQEEGWDTIAPNVEF